MRRGLVLTIGVVLVVTGCRHQTSHYETNVEVTRIAKVRRDDAGKPMVVDVEVKFVDCPGDQVEVVRGGPEFAACIDEHRVGDKLKVSIDHVWSSEGYYTSKIVKLGDCARAVDPDDEASYAMVRECDDWKVNGQKVGFECRYVPEKKLIKACPWFRRR